MSQLPLTIPKQPVLLPAEDYYRLRREGIGFIEQMGSSLWTDYNTHDPGITILEALCYAITDLAFRTRWDLKDLLAPATPSSDPKQPFPNQPFFTAREILTVNPWTPDDFRRLLIDLDGVRNAWVFCKACACDVHYYAWCEDDKLTLSYQKPDNAKLQAPAKKVEPLGLYEILLELEADLELGDLNDRKIEHTYKTIFDAEGKSHPVTMELRFPEWALEQRDAWRLFLKSSDVFEGKNGPSFNLELLKFNRNKTDNTPLSDVELRNNWRNVLYASFRIELLPGREQITIENAALRMFGDTFAKSQTTVSGFETILKDNTTLGFIQRYRNKLFKVEQAVADAKALLHDHRNLDEDYCHVRGVAVEDVAVCADVEVAPDADIERIQAQIWFKIEQYLNPPVPFYTLQELLDTGIPVEDIFNGPKLSNGFIKAEELEAAGLKTVLRTSDIINRLMDIKGVVAVNNLLLSKYDAEGNVTKGAADPTWNADSTLNNGTPLFDDNKTSASWLLFVGALHQPRLYHNLSRFLFYKNGLPFLPRMDEAYDTLTQLRGEAERPKIKNTSNDLPVPSGTFRSPEDYSPVQYSFPVTYGIGTDGLPSHVSTLRRAQARQMKAYLMVFEQHLGNAFAQIAHTADLFSLDPTIRRTYFVREFSEALIQGYTDMTSGLNQSALEGMTETVAEFHERRNRFLDHIMARFGEQFGEYALLLTNLQGEQVALDRLIADKISFVNAYPMISSNRGKAFDYTRHPCSPDNSSGLKKRVSLLLGHPDLHFVWQAKSSSDPPGYTAMLRLEDQNNGVWLVQEPSSIVTNALEAFVNAAGLRDKAVDWEIAYESERLLLKRNDQTGKPSLQDPLLTKKKSEAKALSDEIVKGFREIIGQLVQSDSYDITQDRNTFRLAIKDKHGAVLCRHLESFQTETKAKTFRDELMGWSNNERAILVEHLLLRPKFPGDALFPACTEGSCKTCGDEDPYSFRLTFVMPGWTEPFNTNLEMRDFADRTIRQETPSHLLGKTCWVGNDGFIENPCDPVIDELAELLVSKGLTAANTKPTETDACSCAMAIYKAFSQVFQKWYEDRTLTYFHSDALAELLTKEFRKVNPDEVSCAAVLDRALWADILVIMVKHFGHIALAGWQFERFEDAWCAWLEVNAKFDWTEERVQDRVEAMLRAHIKTGPGAKTPDKDKLCACAAAIVTKYGMAFHNWMGANIKAGNGIDMTTFPEPVVLCDGVTFQEETEVAITKLLKERYIKYTKVSYCLRIVVNLLANLRNTYPGATLHDCDDGSDQNPVRLGKTALGNYPLRQTLSSSDSPGLAPSDRATTQPAPVSGPQAKTNPAKSPKNDKRKGRS